MKKQILVATMIVFSALCCMGGPVPVERGKMPCKERPARHIAISKEKAVTLTGQNTVIVVSAKAAKATQFAADELKSFLSQMLDADIKVMDKPGNGCNIYVGDCDFAHDKGIDIASLPRDGFYIRTFGKDILIAGRDDPEVDPRRALLEGIWSQHYERATLFAVYDFLERFANCRFYFPGELGTYAPKQASIDIPVCDIYDRPDLIYRKYSVYWDGAYFEDKKPGQKRVPEKVLNFYRLRMETAYFPSNHGMNNFRLLDRFAESNPEYFALTDTGQRRTSKQGPFTGHICWSSPVTDVIYEDVKAYLQGQPASTRNITVAKKSGWTPYTFRNQFVDVMPQDGFYLCHCPACMEKGKTPEGLNDMVWNQVIDWAERLKKDGIPGTLTMMAYHPYHRVPQRALPDNIEVNVADTGAWNKNGTPGARGYYAEGKQSRPVGIAEWHKKLGRKVTTWNYMYKTGANLMPGLPAPSPLAVGRYYHAVAPHLFGAYMASNCDRFLYYALNYYVFSRITWDINADYKAIMDEYYRLMYGKASSEMQSLMEEFERLWIFKVVGKVVETNAGPVNTLPSDHEIWDKIYGREKRAELDARFDKALALTEKDSVERRRIELFRREYMQPMHREAANFEQRNQASNIMKLVEGVPVMLNKTFNHGNKSWASTMVSVKRSEDKMLVHFDCEEPYMDKVIASSRKLDDRNTWRDNEVEFLVNPSGDRKNYYQFIINSAGSMSDYKCMMQGAKAQHDISWNSGATVEAKQNDKGFTIDLTIPMAVLEGFKPNEATVNFGRSRVLDKDADYEVMSVLSPLSSTFNNTEHFYRLVEPERELVYDGSFTEMKQSDKNGKRTWRFNKKLIWSQFNTEVSYCALDDKVYYSAPHSMKIVSGDGNGNFVWITLPKLKPSTRYRLSAMVKLENVVPLKAKGGFAFIVRDNNNRFFPNHNMLKGSNDWFAVCYEFTTDLLVDNVKDTRLLPRLFSTNGTVWVDELSLEEMK